MKYIYNKIITSSTLNNPGYIFDIYQYLKLFTSYLRGTSTFVSTFVFTLSNHKNRATQKGNCAISCLSITVLLIGQLT